MTATRLLAIGLLALAAKKEVLHPQYYVTITWGSSKIQSEAIFEFEGVNGLTEAYRLRNSIAKKINFHAQ